MKAEQLRLALRPRPMVEAIDLGTRITQQAVASLRRAYLPFALLLVLACGSTLELAGWLPSLLLWWAKPWMDRLLLHVYARQAFGEATSFADAWTARQRAPWGPLLQSLTLGRLSLWRSYSMPVAQLEGQAGATRRKRLHALLRHHRGTATMMQAGFSWIEFTLVLGAVSSCLWLRPGLDSTESMQWLFGDQLPAMCVLYAAHAFAVLFVEPFYVAAGFAMYLNRRVELEAWDVEQDLRDALDQR